MADKQLTKNQERDLKNYFVAQGDPGFSPERNRAVIEATIKKSDALRKKRQKEHQEQISERVEAAASYLTSRHGAQSGVSVEDYFGKKTLAYLQGHRILDRISLLGGQQVEKARQSLRG